MSRLGRVCQLLVFESVSCRPWIGYESPSGERFGTRCWSSLRRLSGFNSRRLAAVISFHYSTAIAPQRRAAPSTTTASFRWQAADPYVPPMRQLSGQCLRQEETADRHGAEESE